MQHAPNLFIQRLPIRRSSPRFESLIRNPQFPVAALDFGIVTISAMILRVAVNQDYGGLS